MQTSDKSESRDRAAVCCSVGSATRIRLNIHSVELASGRQGWIQPAQHENPHGVCVVQGLMYGHRRFMRAGATHCWLSRGATITLIGASPRHVRHVHTVYLGLVPTSTALVCWLLKWLCLLLGLTDGALATEPLIAVIEVAITCNLEDL